MFIGVFVAFLRNITEYILNTSADGQHSYYGYDTKERGDSERGREMKSTKQSVSRQIKISKSRASINRRTEQKTRHGKGA